MRNISCINYMLTTYCNRMCPDCCCNIPNKKDRIHFDWSYVVNSAEYFKGINRINISGGEPTIHPNFIEFIPKLKELFQCINFTIETNGYGFKKFPEIFKYFDVIQATRYTEKSYINSWDNKEDIEFIKNYLQDSKTKLLIGEVIHTPRKIRKNGIICIRGLSETASYENGILYPCCTGSGVEGANGITLTKNWREEILKVKLPCKNCWFSD